MQYVITGSLGHTGKPITEALVAAGHQVTVITSSSDKVAAIEALGAKAALGSVEDAEFLKRAFAGADAAYLMIPPKWGVSGWRAYQNQVGDNYVAAIAANEIQYVVLLSSVGAHVGEGIGPVDGLYDMEHKLATVPGLNAVLLRPPYFMYNLMGMVGMVKGMGMMGSNFGADPIALAHTTDIAEAAPRRPAATGFYRAAGCATWPAMNVPVPTLPAYSVPPLVSPTRPGWCFPTNRTRRAWCRPA